MLEQAAYTSQRRALQKRLRRVIAWLDERGLQSGAEQKTLALVTRNTWSYLQSQKKSVRENAINRLTDWMNDPMLSLKTRGAEERRQMREFRRKMKNALKGFGKEMQSEEFANFKAFVEIMTTDAQNRMPYLDEIKTAVYNSVRSGSDSNKRDMADIYTVYENLNKRQRQAVLNYRKGRLRDY